MLLESKFTTVFKNENPVNLACIILSNVATCFLFTCVCESVCASVCVDRSLLCSANEEQHLGSYIVYSRIAYNLPFNVNYFISAFNANVNPVFILYLCVCFMFMWHMGLATDSKMSIKFYLLTV